jgi:hypothetical protein
VGAGAMRVVTRCTNKRRQGTSQNILDTDKSINSVMERQQRKTMVEQIMLLTKVLVVCKSDLQMICRDNFVTDVVTDLHGMLSKRRRALSTSLHVLAH